MRRTKRRPFRPTPKTCRKSTDWFFMQIFEYDKLHCLVRPSFAYTSGVYGLMDPLSGEVRYVGSSVHIEKRLYTHHHTVAPKNARPCQVWMAQMVLAGWSIQACLLEEVPSAILGDQKRRNAHERVWIEHFNTLGQADLNVQMAPIGHPNATAHPEKLMRAHINYLQDLLRGQNIPFTRFD